MSNQALLKLLSVCVQVDLLLHQRCSDDPTASSNYFVIGSFVQLIKFFKSSKLFNIARIVRLVRLGKVLNVLSKIEERFVTVRLTAFKLLRFI